MSETFRPALQEFVEEQIEEQIHTGTCHNKAAKYLIVDKLMCFIEDAVNEALKAKIDSGDVIIAENQLIVSVPRGK